MQQYLEPSYERIRRIRLVRQKYLKDTNCSEEQFSQLLGVESSDLKKIESGKTEIAIGILERCSRILGVSVDHLISNKIMYEDQFIEPILTKVQIGSVMHSIRSLLTLDKKSNWRDYSLKSVAEMLGISSMELLRIEEMNKSNHFTNPGFLKRIAEVYNLSIPHIQNLLETSFPRGDKRKEAETKVSDQVRYIKEDGEVKAIVVLKGDLSINDFEQIQKWIKLDVDFLRSRTSRKSK